MLNAFVYVLAPQGDVFENVAYWLSLDNIF